MGFFGVLGFAAADLAVAFVIGVGLLSADLAGAGFTAAGLTVAGLGTAFAADLPFVDGLATSGVGAKGLAAAVLGLLIAIAGFVAAGFAAATGLIIWAAAIVAFGAGLVGLAETGALTLVAGALALGVAATGTAATGALALGAVAIGTAAIGTAATGMFGITGALANFALEATGLAIAALTETGFGIATGSTKVADEPVMRPAATCRRAIEASCTGMTGVSKAGFSARPPLTARLLRLDRFAAVGGFGTCGAETPSIAAMTVVLGAVSGSAAIGRCGWRRLSRRFSGRAMGSAALNSGSAPAIGNADTRSVSDAARATVS